MTAAAIFVTAMAVRLLHLWFIRDAAVFDTLMGDARGYDLWAQRIAAGEWIGGEVFYQAPLYPYFLGAIYAVAGRDLLVVRLVQAVLGAAAAVLVGSAGERLFSRRVGLLAGFGMALYAPAVFFDALLQKTVLDVLFVSVILWLASRIIAGPSQPSTWLWLGVALGGLSLTRENALALVAVAALWAVLESDGSHEGHEEHEEKHTRKRKGEPLVVAPSLLRLRVLRVLRVPIVTLATGPIVTLVTGLAIVLLPVAVRNYAVGGGFYLTTSQFGPNFYIGNNPQSDGTYASLRPGRGAPEFERQDATELAERALGRALTPAEVSQYWTDRGLAFVAGDPGAWFALMARKAALLVNASEMLDTESQETYEEHSPVLRVLAIVGHFGVVMPLAAIGLVAAWADRRRLWPLYAMPAAYAASVVLFYVFARYRFPLVPFLILFGAVGAATAVSLFARATPARRTAAAIALAAVTVAVNWPILSSARMRAITETNLGAALHEAGRFDQAVAHYRRATDLQPDYAPAYNNLGVTLRAQGRVDEAIAAYQEGLRLKDDYPDLHYNLANALLEQNRSDEAARHLRVALEVMPGSAAAHNSLGTALAAEGQYERAAAEFRAAIAAEPRNAALAHRNLGNVLASTGRPDEAIRELERAVALDPSDAAAPYDLGSVLLDLNRFDEAADRFRAALKIRPDYVEALNNLGISLASTGRIADAVPYFERALAIRPDFADAKRNLDTARQVFK
jgi:tetratricopeptide (TPR) repeat protein